MKIFPHQGKRVNCVRISDDKNMVLAGCSDGQISCWDYRSRVLERLRESEGACVGINGRRSKR